MAKSLQDQLLQTGIAKPEQAKKARREKARENKAARHSGRRSRDQQALQQQVSEIEGVQRERERKLAAEHNARRQARELDNTVTQTISRNRIDNTSDEIAYRYIVGDTVRTVYVSSAQRRDLAEGRIGIVWHRGRGSLLPRVVAERLMGKIPERVWLATEKDPPPGPDDPYAEFKVPDDLMW